MILTREAIRQSVATGSIVIQPFDEELLNPNSYNYRLGRFLKISPRSVLDPLAAVEWDEIEIPEDGVLLEPGRLYLGHTMERIGSKSFVTSLIGRSSIGRLGVFLQISADLGHQGAIHSWTLELTAVQPTRVYAGMRIGQVSFWVPTGEPREYQGRYGSEAKPREYILGRDEILRTARAIR
ncbi:dCTP deaminase [Nocardia aurantia]|uniref:dCTP deaminase n=1 Tax=Nocardia aurantia TaxID=2585199 RepID=A0A7K0DTV6_9NOCA|nr:2'-deoxycytidine 5'-triphosphate deaminase [Nocardia aurantia]MQY28792.1 dCTP deaminase [Nocardia aurantia]